MRRRASNFGQDPYVPRRVAIGEATGWPAIAAGANLLNLSGKSGIFVAGAPTSTADFVPFTPKPW